MIFYIFISRLRFLSSAEFYENKFFSQHLKKKKKLNKSVFQLKNLTENFSAAPYHNELKDNHFFFLNKVSCSLKNKLVCSSMLIYWNLPPWKFPSAFIIQEMRITNFTLHLRIDHLLQHFVYFNIYTLCI